MTTMVPFSSRRTGWRRSRPSSSPNENPKTLSMLRRTAASRSMSSAVIGADVERIELSQRLMRQKPMKDERRRNHPKKIDWNMKKG
jgi:hypothetical protein